MSPTKGERPVAPVPGYEPPRIEARLTAEALEREILYAGLLSGGQGG
jgi:hypothetical protein